MTTAHERWLEDEREFWKPLQKALRDEMSEGTNDRREPGDWIPYGRAPLALIPDSDPTPWRWRGSEQVTWKGLND